MNITHSQLSATPAHAAYLCSPTIPPPSRCTLHLQVEIFSEGDEVNELYFIVAGYVEVFASAAQAEQSDKESL